MKNKKTKIIQYEYANGNKRRSIDISIENITYDSTIYNDITSMIQHIALTRTLSHINSNGMSVRDVLRKMFTDFIENLMKDCKPDKFGMKSLCVQREKQNKSSECINILWHHTGLILTSVCDYISVAPYDADTGQYDGNPFDFKPKSVTKDDRVSIYNQKHNEEKVQLINRYGRSIIDHAHAVAHNSCLQTGNHGYINLIDRYLTYMTYGHTGRKIKFDLMISRFKRLLEFTKNISDMYGRLDNFIDSVSTELIQSLSQLTEQYHPDKDISYKFFLALSNSLVIYPEFGTCTDSKYYDRIILKTHYAKMLSDFTDFTIDYCIIHHLISNIDLKTAAVSVLVPSKERVRKYLTMWDECDASFDINDIENIFDANIVNIADDIEHAVLVPDIDLTYSSPNITNLPDPPIEVQSNLSRGAYRINLYETVKELLSILKQNDISDEQKKSQIKTVVHNTIHRIMTLPENKTFAETVRIVQTESTRMLQNLENIVKTLLSIEDESFIMFLADVDIISKKRCKERLAELKKLETNQTKNESENVA